MWQLVPEGEPLPFVALEGCDGVGKSTVRDIIAKSFAARGIPVTLVGQHSWLDPWTTRLIVEVRERRRHHHPYAIADAYFRDKRLHAQVNIIPARTRSLVVADRYVLSDAVYLEALYGIPADLTLARHRSAGTLMPTAIVHVTLDVLEAVERIARRSKQTQHYERPADMSRIMSIYQRVLHDGTDHGLPPTIVFDNTRPDPQSVVTHELLPKLLRVISAAVSTTNLPKE